MVFGTYVGVVDHLYYKKDILISFTCWIPTNKTCVASKYKTRWIGRKMLGYLFHWEAFNKVGLEFERIVSSK